jgi:hypothetical protein
MLATIIAIAVVAGVILWATKTTKKPTASKLETKEEESIGYETGSFSPIIEAKPIKKTTAKPKVSNASKAPKKAKNA